VNVVVTNPNGQTGTLTNGFRYTLLQDDFSFLDTSKWTVGLFTITPNTNINVAASGGQLQIGPTLGGISGNNYNGVKSVNSYDFTGGYAYVNIVQAGVTQVEEVLSVGPNSNNWYSIAVRDVASNTNRIQCRRNISGTQTTLFTATSNVTVPIFIRIRHDSVAGNVVFETAPSSGGVPGAWTQVYSEVWNSSVTLTSTLFELKAGSFNAGASVTPAFSSFQASKP
jgi:hypothetical protein